MGLNLRRSCFGSHQTIFQIIHHPSSIVHRGRQPLYTPELPPTIRHTLELFTGSVQYSAVGLWHWCLFTVLYSRLPRTAPSRSRNTHTYILVQIHTETLPRSNHAESRAHTATHTHTHKHTPMIDRNDETFLRSFSARACAHTLIIAH